MHYVFYKQRQLLRWLLPGLLSLLLAACASNQSPSLAESSQSEEAFSHIATVKIDPSASKLDLEALYGGTVVSFKPEAGFAVLGFQEEQAALTTLATSPNQDALNSPEVSAAGYNAWAGGYNAWAGGFNAWAGGFNAWAGGFNAWAGGDTVPNPPSENQAYWEQLNLNRAYAISRNFGAGVTVAVIDTGFDLNHIIFAGRLTPSSSWKDYVDNDSYPQEVAGGNSYGHGTGVGGLIAQIAPQAKLLPIRVLDTDGKGDMDDVVTAIDWAVGHGANIINLSLGSVEYSNALHLMIDYAASRGVYVVASAGNNGQENGLMYPAQMSFWGNEHVFGVGSVDSNDLLSGFSSYGDGLFMSAPGESIYSAYPGDRTAAFNGTSFAAPLTTGALALAYGEAPATADKNDFWSYFISSLYDSDFDARNMERKGTNEYLFGWGRLDVEALIRTLPGWTSPVSSSELVANGGFETGGMSGWWSSTGTAQVVSSGAASGVKALRFGGIGAGVVYPVSNLQPNTTYTLSLSLKNSVTGSGASIGVINFGRSDIWKWSESTHYGQYSITFTTGATATKADISVWRDGAGYTYLDNVSLKKW